VVQRVLETATKDCESPDVRDRAYIYWRLLSTDPAAAKAVVLAHRPPISLPRTTVPAGVLEELLGEIGSLASVYHKPAETFVGRGRIGADALKRPSDLDDEMSAREKAFKTVVQGQKSENLLDFDEPEGNSEAGGSSLMGGLSSVASGSAGLGTKAPPSILTSSNPLDDLVSIFGSSSLAVPAHSPAIPSPLAPFAVSPTTPKQQQQPQEDLLGIF